MSQGSQSSQIPEPQIEAKSSRFENLNSCKPGKARRSNGGDNSPSTLHESEPKYEPETPHEAMRSRNPKLHAPPCNPIHPSDRVHGGPTPPCTPGRSKAIVDGPQGFRAQVKASRLNDPVSMRSEFRVQVTVRSVRG